jgi:hypothetical protein
MNPALNAKELKFLSRLPVHHPLDDYAFSLRARAFAAGQAHDISASALPFLPQEKAEQLVMELEFLYKLSGYWVEAGLPLYHVTEDLLAALVLTDSSSIRTQDVPLPHPTFVIAVPAGWFSFVIGADRYDVKWILFTNRLVTTDTRTFAFQPPAADDSVPAVHVTMLNSDGQSLAGATFPAASTVGEWASARHNQWQTPFTPAEQDDMNACIRLVVNLTLYISETGHGARIPRQQTSMRRLVPPGGVHPEGWILGHKVRCHPELLKAAKDHTQALRGDRTAWRISKRFVVRGHWRNQAVGPGRLERRLTWIQPFWKGKGPVLQHIYETS